MRAISIAFVLIMFSWTSAISQLSYRYSDWGDGPAKHLMTKEEMKQWKAIRTDHEAEAFIDLFWARRDPTPDTPRNELREAFEQRVAFADQQFTSHRVRGSMSDPGKVLILLGPPYRVSGRAGAPAISSLGPVTTAPTDSEGNLLLPSPRREQNRQVWTYAHDRKPRFIPQSDFVLVFLDEGNNEWQLAHTERTNPDVILQQAVNALIVSPNLTQPPVYASIPRFRATSFKDADLASAYKQFRSADKPVVGPANLTWGEFVTQAGERFVSVQLYAPAGSEITAGQKVTLLSVIENKAGEIVEVNEDATTMIASGRDAYVDKSLQLEPGSYNATFGLAADGRILTATRTTMTVEALDPAATGISPLILSNNIYPLKTDYGPTDPFTFGGLKVVPKGDSLFTPSGDLWYFLELRNPGVTKDGLPDVRVQVEIRGTTPKGPVEMKFPMAQGEMAKLKGTRDRYALGLAIPLEGFLPGEYTMRVRVVDPILGKNYDLEKQFRVRGL